MLPKTSASVKSYDGQTKCVYFLIEDDDLLKKCNTIEPVYFFENQNKILW